MYPLGVIENVFHHTDDAQKSSNMTCHISENSRNKDVVGYSKNIKHPMIGKAT